MRKPSVFRQASSRSSRRLAIQLLESRQLLAVTPADLLGIGILQRLVDEIQSSPYQSQILSEEILQNVVRSIAESQVPTGVTDVINTDAGLASIATGGEGKTYHIVGDRVLPNGTDNETTLSVFNISGQQTRDNYFIDNVSFSTGNVPQSGGDYFAKENVGGKGPT